MEDIKPKGIADGVPVYCSFDAIEPIAKVIPNPRNPNQHPESQIELLAKIVSAQGWRAPITVSKRSGFVVRGHGRLMAAVKLGVSEVPVDYQDYRNEAEEWADLIADNRIAELSSNDRGLLKDILEELDDGAFDMDLTGFDESALEELMTAAPPEVLSGSGDPDEVPEPPKVAVTKPGDLIILGRHRMLCGDSTSITDVDRLMAGDLADMVWTDPPYGVAYVGKTKDALTIQNDELDESKLEDFLRAALGNAFTVCRPGASWYVAAPAGPLHTIFCIVLRDLGVWRQTLNWVKNTFALGRSDYHYRHEPIFYGWKEGAAHYFIDDRTQDSIWEFDKPSRNGEHPTMKPVALVERSINNSSKPGCKILDLFGGSGTTLIASEQTGRNAYLMELDPKYCDVIVERWEKMTGQKAQRPE